MSRRLVLFVILATRESDRRRNQIHNIIRFLYASAIINKSLSLHTLLTPLYTHPSTPDVALCTNVPRVLHLSSDIVLCVDFQRYIQLSVGM